ncbi:MAG: DNA-binding response regulator [Actinobacteria bacterium]|nr:DNA-binding response regulator [Actinomycetota bacterium]
MTEPTRVFVVDDHELVRKGLIDLIDAEEDLTVVGSAANVADALFHFVTVDADIAVLDVRLPDGNGIELCRELISINPRVKVLMLTSFQDDEALLGAVLGGASGYLIKDIKNLELLSSIRAVALGKSFLDTKLISSVTNRLRENKNPASEIYELTDQEQRVLEFIGQAGRYLASPYKERDARGCHQQMRQEHRVVAHVRAAIDHCIDWAHKRMRYLESSN